VPTIKPCFVAEITYVEGAAEKRAPYRAEHLERVAKLQAEGVLVVAGAFDDMSASLFIMDVASEDAAAAIVETDVFYKQRIWTGYTMRKLNRAV
jgi:uncharacterized protein YciI